MNNPVNNLGAKALHCICLIRGILCTWVCTVISYAGYTVVIHALGMAVGMSGVIPWTSWYTRDVCGYTMDLRCDI